jgi:hypothetical protein
MVSVVPRLAATTSSASATMAAKTSRMSNEARDGDDPVHRCLAASNPAH